MDSGVALYPPLLAVCMTGLHAYVLPLKEALVHKPGFPERTAQSHLGDEIRFQVWPTRQGMLKACAAQRRGVEPLGPWVPCIKPRDWIA